jgi:geranylgeranyl reductase family protein
VCKLNIQMDFAPFQTLSRGYAPMSEWADVIVVGAGPAGSTAAAVLARHGLRVLLLDREQFPRDKACGDVVPLGAFLELRKIGLDPCACDHFPINRIWLEGSQGVQREFDLTSQVGLNTCVVARRAFDQTLLEHALSCGAEFRSCNVKAPLFEGGQVIGVTGANGRQTQHYHGCIVIGADGATSAIARGLGRGRKRDEEWAVALRGYLDTDTALDGTIELAFLDHLQPGYAWFFPIAAQRANVGVGMRSDFYKRQDRSLHDLLLDYLARPEIADRLGGNRLEAVQAWPLPLFAFAQQRVFDGALLAGDAGGFVHPITAAGIYSAIITGKCAAEATIHALQLGDLSCTGLALYDRLWQEALAAELKPAVTASKLATVFPHLVSAALLLSPTAQPGVPTAIPFATGKF